MGKQGISAIVATVLMIMTTTAGITLVYTLIIPLFSDISDFKYSDIQLGIVLEGYTVCDPQINFVFVQVNRGSDELNLAGLEIIFQMKGNSLVYEIGSEEAPEKNQRKTYAFNLSLENYYFCPDSVRVVPIIQDKGKIKLVSGTESRIPQSNVGEDFVEVKVDEANSRKAKRGSNNPICPEGETNYGNTCAIEVFDCEFNGWKEGRVHVLTQDVYSDGSCFEIDQNNVTLDGNGFKIYNTYNAGILSEEKNYTTIKNIFISSGGIKFIRTEFGLIENVNINQSGYGIELEDSKNNKLINITTTFNTLIGVSLTYSSSNNTLSKINSNSNPYGIWITDSPNNNISSSNFCNNNGGDVKCIGSPNNFGEGNFLKTKSEGNCGWPIEDTHYTECT